MILPSSGCYSQYGSKGPEGRKGTPRRCSLWSQVDDSKHGTTSSSRDEWRVGLMKGTEEVLWPGLAEGLVIVKKKKRKENPEELNLPPTCDSVMFNTWSSLGEF